MKKSFLLIIFMLGFVNIYSQDPTDMLVMSQLECINITGDQIGTNNQDVIVNVTIKNPNTTNGVSGIFTLWFWEGILWYMNSPQVRYYIGPGQTVNLTLRGTIPSSDYIKIKGPLYGLRVYGGPIGGQQTQFFIKNAELPFTLE